MMTAIRVAICLLVLFFLTVSLSRSTVADENLGTALKFETEQLRHLKNTRDQIQIELDHLKNENSNDETIKIKERQIDQAQRLIEQSSKLKKNLEKNLGYRGGSKNCNSIARQLGNRMRRGKYWIWPFEEGDPIEVECVPKGGNKWIEKSHYNNQNTQVKVGTESGTGFYADSNGEVALATKRRKVLMTKDGDLKIKRNLYVNNVIHSQQYKKVYISDKNTDLGTQLKRIFKKYPVKYLKIYVKPGTYTWNNRLSVPRYMKVLMYASHRNGAHNIKTTIVMDKKYVRRRGNQVWSTPTRLWVRDYTSFEIRGFKIVEKINDRRRISKGSNQVGIINLNGVNADVKVRQSYVYFTTPFFINASGNYGIGTIVFGWTYFYNNCRGFRRTIYPASSWRGWNWDANHVLVSRSHTGFKKGPIKWRNQNRGLRYIR